MDVHQTLAIQPQRNATPSTSGLPFQLHRLGTIMEPDPNDPREAWGVLNPATARGRDGQLYLFPRMVAKGNYSRIGRTRVLFNDAGNPSGVERLGFALEPEATYERNPRTGGGVEDPRITYVAPLDKYVMAYCAYSTYGPIVALAVSDDLLAWRRLGPAHFHPEPRTDFSRTTDKDAALFPEIVPDPQGQPALAMLHRPNYVIEDGLGHVASTCAPQGLSDYRPSIWVSYTPLAAVQQDEKALTEWGQHQLVATPQQPWEHLKLGAGTPPLRLTEGWLEIFHGVSGEIIEGVDIQPNVHYAAGALVLDPANLSHVLYRSAQPILEPSLTSERVGIVPNVVFPTGIDVREGGRIDTYYGMADSRIGAASMVTR